MSTLLLTFSITIRHGGVTASNGLGLSGPGTRLHQSPDTAPEDVYIYIYIYYIYDDITYTKPNCNSVNKIHNGLGLSGPGTSPDTAPEDVYTTTLHAPSLIAMRLIKDHNCHYTHARKKRVNSVLLFHTAAVLCVYRPQAKPGRGGEGGGGRNSKEGGSDYGLACSAIIKL